MPKPVLLIRPDSNETDAVALKKLGLDSVIAPVLQVAPVEDAGAARLLARALSEADASCWLIVTSPRTWGCWAALADGLGFELAGALARGLRVATVGTATTLSLPSCAHDIVLTSPGISAEHLLAELLEHQPATAIIPASSRARGVLPDGLHAAGWQVRQAKVYDIHPVGVAPDELAGLDDGSLSGVIVRSPSAADALAELVSGPVTAPVFAVGPITAERCRSHGWSVDQIDRTRPAAVAAAVSSYLAGHSA